MHPLTSYKLVPGATSMLFPACLKTTRTAAGSPALAPCAAASAGGRLHDRRTFPLLFSGQLTSLVQP